MVLTLIWLVILNSNYWLCFIIIFYVYDLKIHFIYPIPFILIFLILIVTFSHPVMVSFFSEKWHHFTVTVVDCYFWFFGVSSLPMSVTTRSGQCLHPNCFSERSYCWHIPLHGILLLYSSSAVAMTPSMANDLAAALHIYPLLLLLAAHPSKIGQDW